MKNIDPSYQELESLFVNNPKFSRLQSHLNSFNPLRTMKMERMEIRHSAILSWLLDPNESHGLGDQFLKAFLAEALKNKNNEHYPNSLSIIRSELWDAEIRREKQNIDILILSRKNGWAFIIENKFHSKQRTGQLKKYIDLIRKQNEKLLSIGIFLSIFDEEPHEKSYETIRYSSVCEIIEIIIDRNTKNINPEVSSFINHYLNVIKKEANMSSDDQLEMEKIAREIYLENKKALDFIFKHGTTTDFNIATSSIFKLPDSGLSYGTTFKFSSYVYMFSWQNSNVFSFVPLEWKEILNGKDWEGCEKWWAGYPLICFFHLNSDDNSGGKLRLHAEVGPLKNHKERKLLIEKISEIDPERKLIRFQSGASDEGKKYSKFLKNNGRKINDLQDSEEIEQSITTLLEKFNPIFTKITPVIESLIENTNK